MRYLSIFLFLSQLAFAADLYTISKSDSCRLKKNVGGQWVDASKSELEGKSFQIRQFPNTQNFAVRMNGVWYGGPKSCFELPQTDGSIESAENKPTTEAEQKSSESSGSDFNPKNVFVELDLNYLMARGEDFQAGDKNGVTKSAATPFLGAGLKLNYFFVPNLEGWAGFNYSSSSQILSSTFADGTVKYSLFEPEVGAHLYFGSGKFRPYLGAELGYSLLSANMSMAGYTVKFVGMGVSYGVMAGGVYYFSERFGLVAEAGYRAMSFSQFKVVESDLPGYTIGDLEATSVNPISLSLGIRVGF